MIYSIGHSNYPIDKFITLLKQHGITGISDVRSKPYSRYVPHFNHDKLKKILNENGIEYVFLGRHLGARREEQECYDEDGVVIFDKIAQLEIFKYGIDLLKEGSKNYNMAIMCTEKKPLECHRTLLISKILKHHGVEVRHIQEDGTILPHEDVEENLIGLIQKSHPDLSEAHLTRQDILDQAYREIGYQKAYRKK